MPAVAPAMRRDYDSWIFDLDNTLYPASCNLFALISARITHYVARHYGCDADTARARQRALFLEHGTTLNGLMHRDGIDPHDYLAFVHDIALDRLPVQSDLAAMIAALPGRKIVFTNGDAPYARRVLSASGLDGVFDTIHDIHATGYAPKPHAAAYDSLLSSTGIDPARAAYFEDMAVNLPPAKARGMTTIWIETDSDWARPSSVGDPMAGIDFRVPSLAHWLQDWHRGA